MTKAQKGILTENIRLLELIYKLQIDQDSQIFKEEITEAILIAICAQRALMASILRQEQTIIINSSNN